MKRVKLDSQLAAVRDFFGSLPADPNGIALELDGTVTWTVYSSEPERRRAMLERGWALIERAQARNVHADDEEVARLVADAVAEVRGESSQ